MPHATVIQFPKHVCDDCDERVHEVLPVGNDEKWCFSCIQYHASQCEDCDKIIPSDDVHGGPDATLCYDCGAEQ